MPVTQNPAMSNPAANPATIQVLPAKSRLTGLTLARHVPVIQEALPQGLLSDGAAEPWPALRCCI